MVDTLVVTGIHREELGFGDRVAARLGRDGIQVMRIPEGISRARAGTDSLFYDNTRHREIYLQLLQQVKGRYRLLIDLHCGLDASGGCADIYCRDEQILNCIADHSKVTAPAGKLRLVKILTNSEKSGFSKDHGNVQAGARTPIPERIWRDRELVYVGLEIYLVEEGEGSVEDWLFARDLIESVQACARKQHNRRK